MALVQLRSIFAVLAQGDYLAPQVEDAFPHDSLKVGPGQWLVAYAGTAKELSEALGVTQGKTSPAIIIAAAGYYGRADSSVWEWINSRLSAFEYA